MRTAGRWLGVTVAATAVGLGAAACGGGSHGGGRQESSFGRMAGYVWSGHVTAVSASWSVPWMSGAGEAHASTWIGAQAPGRALRAPFIQVGTVEDRGATRPAYRAFWTDTTRGFHPQLLFRVHPGDVVSTGLRLTAGRWRVFVLDTTSGRRAVFMTREESTAGFTLGEWLQEDPSEASGRATRYPQLSPVRMHGLAINGAAPRYRDVYAQWMSLPGQDLAPTPLADGAFAITRAALTPAGRRYLAMARAQNAGARTVDLAESTWTTRTPAREIARVSQGAAASELRYADALAGSRWPSAVRGAIGALVREVHVEAGMLNASARRAPASFTAWRERFATVAPRLLSLAHRVRRLLHLPELVSGQLPASAGRRGRAGEDQ